MDFNKFDKLIHFARETTITEEGKRKVAQELFPLYDPEEKDCFNDQYFSNFRLEEYSMSRSLGLPLIEVAHSLRMSATLLSKAFLGEGLSLDRLVCLAEAETFAEAEIKAKHLKRLESADGSGATMHFLEKAFSKQYGDKQQIDINAGFVEHSDKPKVIVEVHHVKTQPKISEDEALIQDKLGELNAEKEDSEDFK